MSKTFPRWGLPDVNFVETDPDKIKASIINRYETASGRSLAIDDRFRNHPAQTGF